MNREEWFAHYRGELARFREQIKLFEMVSVPGVEISKVGTTEFRLHPTKGNKDHGAGQSSIMDFKFVKAIGLNHCETGPSFIHEGIVIFELFGQRFDFNLWADLVELSDKERALLILEYGPFETD